MKKSTLVLSMTLAIAAVASLIAVPALLEAAPPDTTKKVQIACKPGWRGSAVGTYGGVSFGVACENGKGTTMIQDTVGTAYSVRMGVENQSGAFDCFFSGDAQTVNETCVEVRLTIR